MTAARCYVRYVLEQDQFHPAVMKVGQTAQLYFEKHKNNIHIEFG